MTIASSGPLRLSALRTEYSGPTPSRLWRDYHRGTSYVRVNAGDNPATNNSAAVPTSGPIRLSVFRGQAAGWTFTNATTVVTSGDHIWMHVKFGSDWNGNNWPKTYVNNGTLGSNSTSYYPFVIYQGAGTITFVNNGEVQGAGGQSAGAAGQGALLLTQCTTKPIVRNNGAIRGGGGGGGTGGTGGTGGQGSYGYTANEGPYYDGNNQWQYSTQYNPPGNWIYWAGVQVANFLRTAATSVTIGSYTYIRGALMAGGIPQYYQISRQYPATAITAGGGGGAGGAGGRGIGYGLANLGGSGGAAGAAGGTNAGQGGTGGTGGTGGSWGQAGNVGGTGATGASGNYAGGAAGAAGSAGGAAGFAIYSDAAWSLPVGGTLNGSYASPTTPT